MIFITGDIHGSLEVDRLTGYFADKTNLTKDDYLIILGDVGLCWDNGPNDQKVIKTLITLPVTVLYIDGNHENFGLLESYPISKWHGGFVHEIEDDILHLMRGEIYSIEGRTYFVFGGAASIDKTSRTPGVNWWPQEIPNNEEYENGIKNLEKHNWKVDYILTHTTSYDVVAEMDVELLEEEEELQYYLQRIADNTDFRKWFFGHYHRNKKYLDGKYICVYDKYYKLYPKE